LVQVADQVDDLADPLLQSILTLLGLETSSCQWRLLQKRRTIGTREVPALPSDQEPGMSARRLRFMRTLPVCLVGFGLSLGACTSSGTASPLVSNHIQDYRDSSGWSIKVPPRWHARHFSDTTDGITSSGVQLSNVKLPLPSLVPGYPVQVDGRVLPGDGVGLIIATDPDPKLQRGPIQSPPLPPPNGRYWTIGSSPGNGPYIETLWFRAHGMTFIASAKIGSQTTSRDLKVLASIIKSLR